MPGPRVGASGGRYFTRAPRRTIRLHSDVTGWYFPPEPASRFVSPISAAITDANDDLPGTSRVYLLNMNPAYNAIEWGQFLPLMKFPLYPTDAAISPFLMLLFGSLVNKKTTQHAIIKNVRAV